MSTNAPEDLPHLPLTGPFVSAALICEKVLTEQNGVNSAIRLIDRIFFITDQEGQLLFPQQPVVFYVSFKSGQAQGSYPVEIVREDPSTMRTPVVQAQVLFEGGERGANLIVNAVFAPTEPGLYWFDVLVSGRLVTRMPLRAVFQAPPTAGPGG